MSETRYAERGDIWLYSTYIKNSYFLILKTEYSWQSNVYYYDMLDLLTGNMLTEYVATDIGPIANYRDEWSYLA